MLWARDVQPSNGNSFSSVRERSRVAELDGPFRVGRREAETATRESLPSGRFSVGVEGIEPSASTV